MSWEVFTYSRVIVIVPYLNEIYLPTTIPICELRFIGAESECVGRSKQTDLFIA